MGLRFRKSITLCKGVKLNFGKTGVSITTGVKWFHKTYNFNSDKVTTSVGIPGTGIYYTDTSGGKKKKEKQAAVPNSTLASSEQTEYTEIESTVSSQSVSTESQGISSATVAETKPIVIETPKTISDDIIDTIYRVCDEKIDWFEIMSSSTPTDDLFSKDAWNYLHSVAYKIRSGKTDCYLEVIEKINPFDDLLDYCENFEFGISEDGLLSVQFSIRSDLVFASKSLKDIFLAACTIRVARDTFSLLPVDNIIINRIDDGEKETAFNIREKVLRKIKFRFSSPLDIMSKLG